VFVDDVDGDGNADLVIIPYQRDIAGASEDAVTALVGDGKGAFQPMPGSPLPLAGCRGANSVTAGDLRGDGKHAIVVACAESRTVMLFERAADGRFASTSIPTKGGWGAVAMARLTHDRSSELIATNPDDGSITVFFPQ